MSNPLTINISKQWQNPKTKYDPNILFNKEFSSFSKHLLSITNVQITINAKKLITLN